jgi:hypothetical protein
MNQKTSQASKVIAARALPSCERSSNETTALWSTTPFGPLGRRRTMRPARLEHAIAHGRFVGVVRSSKRLLPPVTSPRPVPNGERGGTTP